MTGYFIALAAVATVASAASNAGCVSSKGVTYANGQSWWDGVGGCKKLTCVNGITEVNDTCKCRYPDNSWGGENEPWYSIPTCKYCHCDSGYLRCLSIQNCYMPQTIIPENPVVTITITPNKPVITPTITQTIVHANVITATAPLAPNHTGGFDGYNPPGTVPGHPDIALHHVCRGPDGSNMEIGSVLVNGCEQCMCTGLGLVCSGVATCPVIPPTAVDPNRCFLGYVTFSGKTSAKDYVPHGYIFKDKCKTCKCTKGKFLCNYTCNNPDNVVIVTLTITTTASLPTPTLTKKCKSDDGKEYASGGKWTNSCGAACTCKANGNVSCQKCPTPPITVPKCVDLSGKFVNNGMSSYPDKCLKCTCMNGEFQCTETCKKSCKVPGGRVLEHQQTHIATCQTCTCKNGMLDCVGTCNEKKCRVPNTSALIGAQTTKQIDNCQSCRCTKNLYLKCNNTCEFGTKCLHNGKMLASGDNVSSACADCTCMNGTLACAHKC